MSATTIDLVISHLNNWARSHDYAVDDIDGLYSIEVELTGTAGELVVAIDRDKAGTPAEIELYTGARAMKVAAFRFDYPHFWTIQVRALTKAVDEIVAAWTYTESEATA